MRRRRRTRAPTIAQPQRRKHWRQAEATMSWRRVRSPLQALQTIAWSGAAVLPLPHGHGGGSTGVSCTAVGRQFEAGSSVPIGDVVESF